MATVKHALSGNSPATDTAAEQPARGAGKGLSFQRYFADGNKSPFDAVEWEKRTALIGNEKGVTIFRQEDVEVPKSWSQTATNIVASKYFHGKPGTAQREGSVRQLIGRVVNTIVRWGGECGYFADAESRDAFRDELTHLLVEQKMAFNSPVWFNVGVQPKPQCSACFINSVSDNMESIMGLTRTEGMLFKWGSGTGTNFSTLRGSRETLSGGGIASGPVSFMKGFDAFAGVIKSGGKTRRAAKMVILNIDHPDIVEFMFLDDTACNLASLSLMKYVNASGQFDVPAFNHAVDVTITPQEILVDNASYPTDKIKENSHNFRPLGLGYANLGSLLMSMALTYDSPEGRNVAGAITALMCGEAYAHS